ncbi:nuclear factor 7, brain-like isoform X1 [Tachysurus vachellii]|uniref:nuclear factor 7, brain-like isoform X1 n=1 Tax=Tachysurus vachellii TaxID=175792 RepID=UPI00296AAEF5|nr:nuclear factor 7, brain-like isoform X1 [Tachysurus vachellii]
MASSLEDDLSCSVCCELYKDPQLIHCGHTFCRQCLKKHWSVNTARSCPLCRRVCAQEPVTNLALRNTSESYQREKEKERKEQESNSKVRCSQHGEKVQFFCKTDNEVICSKCRKERHTSHRVQLLTNAVRQHKVRIKAALQPTEKALQSLKNGTCHTAQIIKYIQSQAQQAEKQIKAEFEKFHHFLRKEEETRITALKKEVERKRGKVEEKIEREILLLSDRVKEVEEEMETEDATFMQNYNFILQRAQYTILDSELSSENLINMAKHVGNLGYRVWEKMTDIFLYYPILLDVNTAPEDFFISDDLGSVGKSLHMRPNPIPFQETSLVLGSEGYSDGYHCWNIEVGDSKHWTLGVCQHSANMKSVEPLTAETGFWGLSRKGESYMLLTSCKYSFRIRRKPRTVQVQLGWWYTIGSVSISRMVKFVDVSDGSVIACYTGIPHGVQLFPFLIPKERLSHLRVAPANPALVLEHTFVERQKNQIADYIFYLFIMGLIIWVWLCGVRE